VLGCVVDWKFAGDGVGTRNQSLPTAVAAGSCGIRPAANCAICAASNDVADPFPEVSPARDCVGVRAIRFTDARATRAASNEEIAPRKSPLFDGLTVYDCPLCRPVNAYWPDAPVVEESGTLGPVPVRLTPMPPTGLDEGSRSWAASR
jgi:hypothetical protein